MPEKISNKDRMKIPRQVMPEQDPLIRRNNFGEVNLGFTEELLRLYSGIEEAFPGKISIKIAILCW